MIARSTTGRLIATALATLAIALGATAPVAAAACPGANLRAEEASIGQLESATLCLMNKQRTKLGLDPLKPQKQLRKASLIHTLDMLTELLFSHDGSNGSDVTDRIRKAGYLKGTSRWWVGENIAYGYGETSKPAEIVKMLMKSPGHRHNILDKTFEDVGVTVEYGTPEKQYRDEGATYTTDFGARRK